MMEDGGWRDNRTGNHGASSDSKPWL